MNHITLTSKSYPYLAVAKAFHVSYSEVLAYVEQWEQRKSVYVQNKWHVAVSQAYSREMERRRYQKYKNAYGGKV